MKRTIELTKKDLKEMISEAKSEVPTKEGLYDKLCKYKIACCKEFRESAPEEIEKSFIDVIKQGIEDLAESHLITIKNIDKK